MASPFYLDVVDYIKDATSTLLETSGSFYVERSDSKFMVYPNMTSTPHVDGVFVVKEQKHVRVVAFHEIKANDVFRMTEDEALAFTIGFVKDFYE
jgi:hypothetical protein